MTECVCVCCVVGIVVVIHPLTLDLLDFRRVGKAIPCQKFMQRIYYWLLVRVVGIANFSKNNCGDG